MVEIRRFGKIGNLVFKITKIQENGEFQNQLGPNYFLHGMDCIENWFKKGSTFNKLE